MIRVDLVSLQKTKSMELVRTISNKSYTLMKLANDESEWVEDIDSCNKIELQFGSTMGLLCHDFSCLCGHIQRDVYFFCLSETDLFFAECLKVELSSSHGGLVVCLPKAKGLFVRTNATAFNDRYILESLVDCITKEKDNGSIDLIFKTFEERIRLRTMFKKLYYRSFRLAFAPGKKGELRNRQELFDGATALLL